MGVTVTTVEEVAERVRMELGDQATSFDVVVKGNGIATRFETGTYPIDGTKLSVTVNGVEEFDLVIEERTGVVTFDVAPVADAEVRFRGVKYRYFGSADMAKFIEAAVAEQCHNRTDSFGRQITLKNMPLVEVYPLAILACTKALWALLTDAAFDIDIYAPDGVSIPRSQRYRQLMELIEARKAQYKQYADALNIGIDRIEVFNLRRVSKMTGRLVPVFVEREIEDNSKPVRAYLPTNTLGSSPVPSNMAQQDISLVRGDTSVTVVDLGFDGTEYDFKAQAKLYSDSETAIVKIAVTLLSDPSKVELRMNPEETRRLPIQSVWDLQATRRTDPTDVRTPVGGRIHASRDVSR